MKPQARDNSPGHAGPATPHLARQRRRPPRASRRAWPLICDGAAVASRTLRGLIAAAVLCALVAGLPWALVHYIGWPLPNHIPTWDDISAVLLGPITSGFLLDFLSCLCWIAWSAFAIDVARCTMRAAGRARLPESSTGSPLYPLAAILIGAVIMSILSNRTTSAPPPPSWALHTGHEVAATAPVWRTTDSVQGAAHDTARTRELPSGSSAAARGEKPPVSVIVRAPHHGVHDSLSRIAQRTLGDASRWPEIYALNKGKPQPYGHTFTNPHLIYPGEELTLPTDKTPPTPPRPDRQRPQAKPSRTTPTNQPTTPVPPTSARPSISVSSLPTPHAPPATTGTHSPPATAAPPAYERGPNLFIGLGFAAAVSAALLIARRRFRSQYQPGSGDRNDYPVAPVIYQLRLAHLRAVNGDADDDRPDRHERNFPVPPPSQVIIGGPGGSSRTAPALGLRDGREIALDLAGNGGLGLVGIGAVAAARALLVTILTAHRNPASAISNRPTVVICADAHAALFGHGAQLPANLRVAASVDEALDALEAEILMRATDPRGRRPAPEYPPMTLVTPVSDRHLRRLQAVIDNGAPFGVTGLLLGQWQAGITAHVRNDGIVSATSPGTGEALRGTRMFHLGEVDTGHILTLLHHADAQTMNDPKPPLPWVPAADRDERRPPAPAHSVDTSDDLDIVSRPIAAQPAGAPDIDLEIVNRRTPPTIRQSTPVRSDDDNDDDDAPSTMQSPVVAQDARVVDEPAMPAARDTAAADVTTVPVRIAVFGPPRVFYTSAPGDAGRVSHEITHAFQPRTRELLAFLALHPDGASREALVAALWADNPSKRTTNAMNTALSRLRQSLAKATDGAVPDIALVADGRYRLDPMLVDVDYWRFNAAVTARRTAATDAQRIAAHRSMVNSYAGPLADGLSTEWIETAREAVRRDAIDAVSALARALVEDDPQQTLDLLEVARAFDPHNEALYRDIMRLQERLGQPDAIPRTLGLLTTRLAELGDQPTDQAIDLATRLTQRHEQRLGTTRTPGDSGRTVVATRIDN